MSTRVPDDGRYGKWAGDPYGMREIASRCVVEVWPPNGWHAHQCCRKRGHGPRKMFCKMHAKLLSKRRKTKEKPTA